MKKSLYLLLFSLVTLLGGCSQQSPLNVGVHPWIGYESLYLAEELKIFPSDIRLHKGTSTHDSLDALRSGQLDAAALTLDEVFQARSQGIPLTVVMVFDASSGADALIAKPTIKNLQDLQDQRIAYEAGAVGELMLTKLLQKADLNRNQMQLLSLPRDQQIQSWQNNQVDAIITYEPIVSELQQLGGHTLFDSRQIPNTIFDVLAVRTDRLASHSAQIKTLISGYFTAQEHAAINREASVYRIATRQNISPQQVKVALRGIILPSLLANKHYLEADSEFAQASAKLNQVMVQTGLLSRPDTLKQLFTSKYLPDE